MHYTLSNTSYAPAVTAIIRNREPRGKVNGGEDYTNENDDEDRSYNESYLPKDLQLEQQALEQKLPKQVFQVEVEEWNVALSFTKTPSNFQETSTGARYEDNNLRNINHNFQNYQPNPSKSVPRNEVAVQPQKPGSSIHDGSYTVEFCDHVFEVFGQRSTLCKRELAETSSAFHVNVSTYFLSFRELGDIFIFSPFLDTRGVSYFIRLMTLGGKDHDNSKFVFWCVFYVRSRAPSPGKGLTSDLKGAVIDSRNVDRLSTQLTYYSASDGHNKSSQFYIMSCPVPEGAKSSLLPPYRGLFQVIIGDLQRPFLGKSQQSLTLRIIRNLPGSTISYRNNMQHKRTHSVNSDNDLLTLGELHSKGNSYNKSSKNNNENIKDNMSTVSHVESDGSGTTETVITNSTEDKIVSCVAPLQGTIGVVQLVEFIELTLLLGSQHIVFYTFQVSDEIKRVLFMYEQRGLVTVLPWSLPYPDSVWAKGRDMALNDCLYRTMHIFDYALFLDLDEFLVPRVTSDIPSFLKYLKSVHRFNSTRFSDLVFSSTYFPPPTKAQYKNLTNAADFTRDVAKFVSLKSVHRTYFNPKHTLRLIKISKALRVGAGERKRTSFTISSRFAVVHHYSHCPQDASIGNKVSVPAKPGTSVSDICGHTKTDFIMWRYKSVLIPRVKDSVIRLNRG
ncbi:hypothetical protein BsWGS_11099 [Bradybaena similaris]